MSIVIAQWVVLLLVFFIFLMYRTGSAQGGGGGGGGMPPFLNRRYRKNLCNRPLVILVALRPASLTHKNPQGRKIIHGMRPVGRKDRSNRSI